MLSIAQERVLKGFETRTEVLQLDVANNDSVDKAAKYVAEKFGAKDSLYGVVNNAGVWIVESMEETLSVNCYGAKKVIDSFLPMLKPKGTIEEHVKGFNSVTLSNTQQGGELLTSLLLPDRCLSLSVQTPTKSSSSAKERRGKHLTN